MSNYKFGQVLRRQRTDLYLYPAVT